MLADCGGEGSGDGRRVWRDRPVVRTYLVLPVLDGGGMSAMAFLLVAGTLEVEFVGKAPDRSAAAASELLRLLMVVAGEEVGADDVDNDEGGAASGTTTSMFFTSPLLPRHRGRQLMPTCVAAAVGRPGWDLLQTQLFADEKRHWDRQSEDRLCTGSSDASQNPFCLAMRFERYDAIVSITT